jgi:salicylate hydroxylase
VLARILSADITTRASLPLALEAYQAVRRPYGNKLVMDARLALREFQYNSTHGGDMMHIKESIRHIFEEAVGIGGRDQTGPKDDANRGIFWMEVQQRASRPP